MEGLGDWYGELFPEVRYECDGTTCVEDVNYPCCVVAVDDETQLGCLLNVTTCMIPAAGGSCEDFVSDDYYN